MNKNICNTEHKLKEMRARRAVIQRLTMRKTCFRKMID